MEAARNVGANFGGHEEQIRELYTNLVTKHANLNDARNKKRAAPTEHCIEIEDRIQNIGTDGEGEVEILVWNMRGMASVDKMDALKDLIKKTRPTACLIQETHMMKVTNWWVNYIWVSDQHQWRFIPSLGLSGGLLTIWDDTALDCIDELVGQNTLSQKFKSKVEDYEWTLTNVYSPCTYWERWEFWEEVEDLTGWVSEHWCMAGDFNAIRRRQERNKPGGSKRNTRLFNEYMEENDLVDLPLNGGLFTWSSMQPEPLLCRLDRAVISPQFESKFPLLTQTVLSRTLSDHSAILITTANVEIKNHHLEWRAIGSLIQSL